jgi:hypothetical protein
MFYWWEEFLTFSGLWLDYFCNNVAFCSVFFGGCGLMAENRLPYLPAGALSQAG